MLRFSNAAVPDGKVPSTGNWLTRISSPRPSIIFAVTSRTNAGAWAGTIGGRSKRLVAAAGTATSNRRASVLSTASKLRRTTSAPLVPYVFSIDALMRLIASSRGSTPEIAKKQVCSTVLIRPPRPLSRATAEASITKKRSRFSRICACSERDSRSHTASGPCGVFSRNVPPRAARRSTSMRSRKPGWWQAMKLADSIR